jgi:hypothetical protein
MSTPDPTKTGNPGLLAGGAAAGVLAAIAALDQLLVQHGELAATTMTKLGPLLGPIWTSLPLLMLVGWLGWRAAVRWRESQLARAAEAKARAEEAAAANAAARDLAEGLTGLRGELHSLRSDLRLHADATETRLRDHDAGLRAVQAEVSTVSGRVDLLEGRPKRRVAARR